MHADVEIDRPQSADDIRTDVAAIAQKVAARLSGTLSEAELRAFRVPMGIYEQRESGRYMLRCRFTAGVVRPMQLRALAAVAHEHGNGVLHVTSRQDVQIHRVELAHVVPALVALCDAGIATKGGGGNTVRNVAACGLAGVCPAEVFDVTPHVESVSRGLLQDRPSFELPRKYKLAFSGCAEDCAAALLNDLGFIARLRDDVPGFAVYVGGGMGAASRIADLLEEFVPAEQAHAVAEAVRRVFDRHGNRKNRNRARLRHLVERIGLAELRRLYAAELEQLRAAASGTEQEKGAASAGPVGTRGPAAPRPWTIRAGAFAEREPGRLTVPITLTLGDLTASSAELLASIAERYGDGILRATQDQNLALRGVTEHELGPLRQELAALPLAPGVPPSLARMTVCAGAATCRLGICLSRGLAGAISDAVANGPQEVLSLEPVRLHISGCPNACGRHPLAQIGLFGVAKRVASRLVPHYVVQLGGRLGVGRTRLAEGRAAVPARSVPAFVVAFLEAFAVSKETDMDTFIERDGATLAERLAQRHGSVPAFERDASYYHDWGSPEPFSLAGRGPGECGAGVFDLIELDLGNARGALAEHLNHRATVLASRALLITRGEQPSDDGEALGLFRRLFIDEGLIDVGLAALVDEAKALSDSPLAESAFRTQAESAHRLVTAVRALYDGMDASLRFNVAAKTTTAALAPTEQRDFRGVACPLNYVKTRMALDALPPGATLLALLDEQGARNVPASVERDGHVVASMQQDGDHWRLLVRKAG